MFYLFKQTYILLGTHPKADPTLVTTQTSPSSMWKGVHTKIIQAHLPSAWILERNQVNIKAWHSWWKGRPWDLTSQPTFLHGNGRCHLLTSFCAHGERTHTDIYHQPLDGMPSPWNKVNSPLFWLLLKPSFLGTKGRVKVQCHITLVGGKEGTWA